MGKKYPPALGLLQATMDSVGGPPIPQDELLVLLSCHGDTPGTCPVSRYWHEDKTRSAAEHEVGGYSLYVYRVKTTGRKDMSALLNVRLTLFLFQVALLKFHLYPHPRPRLLKGHLPGVPLAMSLQHSFQNPLK